MKQPTLEELVDSYQKAKSSIEELEAERKVIGDAILDALKAMMVDGTKIGNWYVKRVRAMIYTGVSLATAKSLGATKMKETVDMDLLRKMQAAGQKVAGAKQIVYVKVTAAE